MNKETEHIDKKLKVGERIHDCFSFGGVAKESNAVYTFLKHLALPIS